MDLFDNIESLLVENYISELCTSETWEETAKKLADSYSDLSGFSEACYDMNTARELYDALQQGPEVNITDQTNWGIDSEEWESEIKKALFALAYDAIYEELIEANDNWYLLEA